MLGKSTAFSENRMLNFRGKLLDLKEPKIMGILNLTSDSFYDGGINLKDDFFLEKAEELHNGGASIIDVGAVSTKPGSRIINDEEEWKILERPLQLLRKQQPEIILSVDTYNSATAQKAADIGVETINDISGGTIDNKMFDVIAKNKLAYVLMHIHGVPENMQQYPVKGNVVKGIRYFFDKTLQLLQDVGVESIMLDPGFGFGKTIDQNYQLLRELKQFNIYNWPILAGVSRKSMIFKHLKINPQEALNGTTVLNTFALLNGAKVLRVHDAKEAHETIRLFLKYNQF
ncbi:MAG: dihydropteroate synthase [Bacteroidales bacterium]|jgi:dihydropteroate synthase|nr:dihydropteroate synthase [Bacteroidales bacterium]